MRQDLTLSRRRMLAGTAAVALGVAPSSKAARAATYPDKPIVFICPWPAGGTADSTMRALCVAAGRELGQPIVLQNRPGASGMLGLRAMAQSRPDGYTIGQIPITVARFSQLGTTPLDPSKDFTYLARTSGQTIGLAVRSDSRWNTLEDFLKVAKASPGKLTYGMAGTGGANHIAMEELGLVAEAKFTAVPYKGGSEALQGLLGGQIDSIVDSSSWAPYVKAGTMRLLATFGSERTREFRSVPTLMDRGYKVTVDAPNGIGAPAGLDPAIAQQLRTAFKAAVQSKEFQTACAQIDAPVMYLDGPEYQKYMAETMATEKILIERLNLKALLARS